MKNAVLIGNPNCGKTTIFNFLTKSNNKVANWPGVTVESSNGTWYKQGINLIDLPGCYSIYHADTMVAADEKMTIDFICYNKIDLIINVIDTSNLTRSLYLTTQLLETGIDVLVILNKIDLSKKMSLCIDRKLISKILQLEIIELDATDSESIDKASTCLSKIINCSNNNQNKNIKIYHADVYDAIEKIKYEVTNNLPEINIDRHAVAINLLSGSETINNCSSHLQQKIQFIKNTIEQQYKEDFDIITAQCRYDFIKKLLERCVTVTIKQQQENSITKKIDSVLTNRFLGFPCLVLIMYCVFCFSINIGTALQNLFTNISNVVLIDGLNNILFMMHLPLWATKIIIQGFANGIVTLISFIPIVFTIFYSISMLEESGYMARAAFVADKIMRTLHLPGKAFIPLIISFGCNVPAILATRTLESQRERVIAGIMTPFMSCNARLAVFAVFANAFFPHHTSLVILSLYLIGIVVAILSGIVMCHVVLPGKIQPLILELPPYHIPKQKQIIKYSAVKAKNFSKRLGKFIIITCIVISIATNITWGHNTNILEALGKVLTPAFNSIGISSSNWPAAVSIINGFIAKETVIITMQQLYQHSSDFNQSLVIPYLPHLLHTIYTSLQDFIFSILPWKTSNYSTNDSFNTELAKILRQNFSNINAVWSYLLFNLLYIPCISTVATFAKEVNWRWAIFSMTWSITIAYNAAMVVYCASLSNINWIKIIAIAIISIALNILFACIIKDKDYEKLKQKRAKIEPIKS